MEIYFHCKHRDSRKSFSTVYLLDMLVPSSSNVAFVLRNFFIIFKEILGGEIEN